MISVEKLMILKPLQKLPNNVGNLGKIIIVTSKKSPNLVTLVVTYYKKLPFSKVLALGEGQKGSVTHQITHRGYLEGVFTIFCHLKLFSEAFHLKVNTF